VKLLLFSLLSVKILTNIIKGDFFMKKILPLLVILVLIISLTVGCNNASPSNPSQSASEAGGSSPTEGAKFEDGIYFAIEDEFAKSGWKYHVILTVKDGEIIDAVWSGTHRIPQDDKYTTSVNGKYPMVASGGAQSDWHVQADNTVNYFLETQTIDVPEDFYTTEEGHTDAIAGVSIHVSEFYNLVEKALAGDPVPEGSYKSGYITSQLEPDSKGWQYASQFIVVNGTIVDVNYNSISESGDKKGLGYDYGMKEKANSAYEWFEYAEMIEDYIIEAQNFEVNYTSEQGHTDTIASVTITVNQMEELFNLAFGL
jgi:major membrane immunogen (membrane-anchored lipoprotein)